MKERLATNLDVWIVGMTIILCMFIFVVIFSDPIREQRKAIHRLEEKLGTTP